MLVNWNVERKIVLVIIYKRNIHIQFLKNKMWKMSSFFALSSSSNVPYDVPCARFFTICFKMLFVILSCIENNAHIRSFHTVE